MPSPKGISARLLSLHQSHSAGRCKFFGLDEGPSSAEKGAAGQITSAAGNALNQGNSDLLKSSSFFSDILSGDASKRMQALAPIVSAAKKSAQSDALTRTEFGGRSGGIASENAAGADRAHAEITDAAAKLTDSSAKSLADIGKGMFDTGVGATQASFTDAAKMQAQRADMWDDIFSSIGKVAGAVAGLPGVSSGASQALNSVGGAL